MAQKILELRNIKKSYGDNVILDHFNLTINENEFVTLLGPSGCGKTTTLRIIGGFETMEEGQLLLDGVEIQSLPAHKRPINTVFQRYSLFPNMNIFDNIAFGLRNNVYSNVYDIGTMNLMNEYGFDEEEVDALQRKLSRIEKPKDVKAYVISTFKHDSPYYQFSEIITSLDKERHFKTYSEAKNDVLAILKNLNVDIALNIEDSCKYNAAKKEILSLIAKEDKYYKMISTIEDRKFKEDVIRGEVIKALKFWSDAAYRHREGHRQ